MKFKSIITSMLSLVLLFTLALSANAAAPAREDREGVLSNGIKYKIHYLTDDEIKQRENMIQPFSVDWSGNVNVPISNPAGTNGKQLGYDFVIAPDTKVVIGVGNLPDTMPSVNIGAEATNGMWGDWIPNVAKYSEIELVPGEGYTSYSFRVKVSTSESASKSARFTMKSE